MARSQEPTGTRCGWIVSWPARNPWCHHRARQRQITASRGSRSRKPTGASYSWFRLYCDQEKAPLPPPGNDLGVSLGKKSGTATTSRPTPRHAFAKLHLFPAHNQGVDHRGNSVMGALSRVSEA